MLNKEIYLDHAATTAVDKRVLNEMLPYFSENYGNASSVYGIARKSKQALDEARERVAKVLNSKPEEIYFTAGGSESDNLAIKGIMHANKRKGNHLITTKIEHPAVLNTCKKLEKEGYEVTYLNVDKDGLISIQELENAIRPTTVLISIMFANNEIGTIQDIEEIGKLARSKGVLFHTDAVQAIGNVRIDVEKMNIDALSLSAHKFYGPKGVGALYVRKGIIFHSVIDGGHQEKGKRAGTENVAGIVGLGKAIELIYDEFDSYNAHLIKLRDLYIKKVEEKIPYVKLNGHRTQRLPGNANFSFEFIEGESLLLMLDIKGIYASSGSACTSGSLDPSHVLLAIGLKHEIAHGSLRTTFGRDNTVQDVDYVVDNLVQIVDRLRQMSPLYEEVLKQNNK
ncbi:MAG: cysteine desulfurase NifS [Clostridiales bacterium]|nr:cysteine desulfurase NifS [Clostridiales bacterium]